MERDCFYPRIADRDAPVTWAEKGQPDAWGRARAKAKQVLATHHPAYLTPEAAARIQGGVNILLEAWAMVALSRQDRQRIPDPRHGKMAGVDHLRAQESRRRRDRPARTAGDQAEDRRGNTAAVSRYARRHHRPPAGRDGGRSAYRSARLARAASVPRPERPSCRRGMIPVWPRDEAPTLALIRAAKAGDTGPTAQRARADLAVALAPRCDHLIVACTELSLPPSGWTDAWSRPSRILREATALVMWRPFARTSSGLLRAMCRSGKRACQRTDRQAKDHATSRDRVGRVLNKRTPSRLRHWQDR